MSASFAVMYMTGHCVDVIKAVTLLTTPTGKPVQVTGDQEMGADLGHLLQSPHVMLQTISARKVL